MPIEHTESSESLDSSEISRVKEAVNDEAFAIFYEYNYGSYEGEGYMFILTLSGWIVYDMGHCSCYGPIEHLAEEFPKSTRYASLTDASSAITTWSRGERIERIIALAHSHELYLVDIYEKIIIVGT